MFFTCGKYTLQAVNQGQRIHFRTEDNVTYQVDLDIESILQNHLENHIHQVTRILKLFDDADPNKILDDPLGARIILYLPETKMIPGQTLQGNELTEWHHKQLLETYNDLHGIKLPYELIKRYI